MGIGGGGNEGKGYGDWKRGIWELEAGERRGGGIGGGGEKGGGGKEGGRGEKKGGLRFFFFGAAKGGVQSPHCYIYEISFPPPPQKVGKCSRAHQKRIRSMGIKLPHFSKIGDRYWTSRFTQEPPPPPKNEIWGWWGGRKEGRKRIFVCGGGGVRKVY